MSTRFAGVLTAALAVVFLTSCTPDTGDALPVTTASPETEEPSPVATVATPEPTPSEEEPAPEAEPGSRENPLAAGEMRRLSEDSMWIVGARATEVHDDYLVLPIILEPDWKAFEDQVENYGADPDAGVSPVASLDITFVAASGQSYRDYDYQDFNSGVPSDEWFSTNDIFPPAEKVEAQYFVNVPSDDQDGVWRIANSAGDAVFIAQQ